MEEIVQGNESNTGGTPSAELTSSAQDAHQSVPVQENTERVFRQSEVNDIVKKAKQGWEERYQRLRTEQPEYAQQKFGTTTAQQPKSIDSTNEEHFRRLAAEEAQRLRDQWVQEAQTKSQEEYAKKVVDNFWNKVNAGKEKYEDFDSITGNIQLNQFPNTVQLLAEHVENASDVLYELGKDRFKLAQLEQLAERSAQDAIVQAQRLSSIVKKNEEARQTRMPNEPLSQLRPTTTSVDNRVMSIRDYKSKYRG